MFDLHSYMLVHKISFCMFGFGKCDLVTFLSLPFPVTYEVRGINLEYYVFQGNERLNCMSLN